MEACRAVHLVAQPALKAASKMADSGPHTKHSLNIHNTKQSGKKDTSGKNRTQLMYYLKGHSGAE